MRGMVYIYITTYLCDLGFGKYQQVLAMKVKLEICIRRVGPDGGVGVYSEDACRRTVVDASSLVK